jgi:ATP-dependent Clp protease ATP-binding subunit ClpC
MSPRAEPELVALRKLAEELARGRNERTSTGHLLAAIATVPSDASDLLLERRLDADVLLKATRVAGDDQEGSIARAVQRARDFSVRASVREPSAIHLLFALCQERGTSAHRAIEQCGADVTKLRTAAMQRAMGLLGSRRTPLARSTEAAGPRPASPPRAPTHAPHAPLVPLTPHPAKPRVASPRPPNAGPPAKAPSTTPKLSPTPAGDGPKKLRVVPAPRASSPPNAGAAGTGLAGEGAAEARFELDPKRFPTLTAIGRNLTLAAARGELDPVAGREPEIERTLDVLAKRHANNPCLVGAAGVGKTSVVRGLARRIAEGKDVGALDDRIVIEIETPTLLAGTAVRGALAERLQQIKAEVKRAEGKVVVFFDEVHTLFGPDAGDEAASELKLALARGELACIGATTTEEYRRFIHADAALSRRFSPIEVEELSPEDAMLALESVAPTLERHHKTRFLPEALAASVRWSMRYVPDRALPDKAVSILDLAGARAQRRKLDVVRPEDVADVVADLTSVPKERLLETDRARMLRCEEILSARIVGQKHALARIATVLRRNASGFRSQRPIGSFLLLGPTGVGKTETAKAIAELLFHSPHAMTRLDFSEYAEAHAVARLIGAPPGYVGHDAGGQLTEAVRRRPYQVVLLDEIEKAHRDVLEAFLQVFDEGRLTDGRGRTIDFTNTVIVLTSNIGADAAAPAKASRGRIGFGQAPSDPSDAYDTRMLDAARAALPPELYNRLDEVLAFAPLTRADVAEVARRMLADLACELEGTKDVRIDVSDEAIGALLDSGGFDPELGARPMRRAIARLVEAPIADLLLRGELSPGDVALVEAEAGRVTVDVVRAREKRSRG